MPYVNTYEVHMCHCKLPLVIVMLSIDSGEEQMAYTEDNVVVQWASAVNGTCPHHLINNLE